MQLGAACQRTELAHKKAVLNRENARAEIQFRRKPVLMPFNFVDDEGNEMKCYTICYL